MNVSKKHKWLRSVAYLKIIGYISTVFTEVNKNAVCLLDKRRDLFLKEYIMSRYYVDKNADYGSTLSAEERPTNAKELDRKLVNQQDIFKKDKIPKIPATRGIFIEAYNMANHSDSL
ncbi:hypothetical protein RF11_11517 [Thelohanellus kitauei]|uniref:Uncharacterized protein n=1 Tax=Thelohanellus kitauei TaxID=669202 RepID=A0A0C2N2H4_THEKT|nr:hypothetical protein RF11_04245 [Thelohanellus kitauei]KII71411.1 hypothetical protein RF11_11517 [Thelohanellus kitauei]